MEVGWDHIVKGMEFVQRCLGEGGLGKQWKKWLERDRKGVYMYIHVGRGEARHYVSFPEVVME